MLAKLLGVAFGGKATVASAALILAGALVTGGAGDTDAALEPEETLPAPMVAASPTPLLAPVSTPAPLATRKPDASPSPSIAPAACAADPLVRESALRTIRTTFESSRAALENLASERSGSRAAAALGRADTMLASVDRTAEELASKAGSCAADVREVSDRAVHAMEMIVDLAKSATAPTPTPRVAAKPKETHKRR